jgi:signal transduction histidine kinase
LLKFNIRHITSGLVRPAVQAAVSLYVALPAQLAHGELAKKVTPSRVYRKWVVVHTTDRAGHFQGLSSAPIMPPMSERIAEIVALVRRVRHDANNPITAALGHVQLLLDDPAVRDEEVRDSLRIVESELRRLIEILKRLGEIQMDG